jgi:hypothetical protein
MSSGRQCRALWATAQYLGIASQDGSLATMTRAAEVATYVAAGGYGCKGCVW